jgi:hypothetical protein
VRLVLVAEQKQNRLGARLQSLHFLFLHVTG